MVFSIISYVCFSSCKHFSIQMNPWHLILQGEKHYTVDSGIPTFCNHGCNGTYNYADYHRKYNGEYYEEEEGEDYTEMNVDLDHVPEDLLNKASSVFSPVFERHLRQISAVGGDTSRDIRRGEEILCNYLSCELIRRALFLVLLSISDAQAFLPPFRMSSFCVKLEAIRRSGNNMFWSKWIYRAFISIHLVLHSLVLF